MPGALGTGWGWRSEGGEVGMEGHKGAWGWLERWIMETAPSCSCAGASRLKIGGRQKEMLSLLSRIKGTSPFDSPA